jgi:UDP-N-acetylmuramoyl-tripeptide--D-alanyl-D-alanine ligase
MRYRIRDLPAMFSTPAGRLQLRAGVAYRLWPLLSRLARLHRQTRARDVRVIAVVGSFAKSTTTRAVSTVLGVPLQAGALFNAWSSIAFAILRIRPTERHAVIEVGISGPGQMESYARVVRPSITIVTSVGSEHQRTLGSLETTRTEKAWMVRVVPPSGTVVLNGDDPHVVWMKGQTQARVVTFGFGESCDVRAGEPRLDWPHGMRFQLNAFGKEREVTVRFIGRHMVYPALAAIAVSELEGFALDESLSALKALAPTPGRLDTIFLSSGVVVLRDDYKSTLETIQVALDVLAEIPAPRRIVMLGDVSEPPGSQRPIYQALGERIARIATHLIVFGHGLEKYSSGAKRAGMPKSSIIDGGRTVQQAAETLAKLLQPGDVVLIKGRDTQKLDRVRLILQGRPVKCDIRFCNLHKIDCDTCPMLERGWGRHRPIM